MVGLGVASFGHVNGVHMQNLDTWETYSAAVERGELPLGRAYRPDGRGADDPRARPAAEAGIDPARVLPRRSTGWTCFRAFKRRDRLAPGGRLPGAGRRREGGALARRVSSASTSSCPASSCRTTPASATPRRVHALARSPEGHPAWLTPGSALRAPARAPRRVPGDRRGRHRPLHRLLPLHGGGRARPVARGRAQHRAPRLRPSAGRGFPPRSTITAPSASRTSSRSASASPRSRNGR